MSYTMYADEMPEQVIRAEIRRRLKLRAKGLCDYCERPVTESKCRFPDRHKLMRGQHSRFEVKRGKA